MLSGLMFNGKGVKSYLMRPSDSVVSLLNPVEAAVKAAQVKMSWTPDLFMAGFVADSRMRWRFVGVKGYRGSRLCTDFFMKGPIHVWKEYIRWNRILSPTSILVSNLQVCVVCIYEVEMTVQPAHLGRVPGISQLSKTRNLMNQLLFLGYPERSKNAYI